MLYAVTSWHWKNKFSEKFTNVIESPIIKVSVEGINKRIGIKMGEIYAPKNGRIWWLGRKLVARI